MKLLFGRARNLAFVSGAGLSLFAAACGSSSGTYPTTLDPVSTSGKSAGVAEAWDPTNNPSIFSGDYQTSFESLPKSGKVDKQPWSDSYWPSNKGGIANRWNATSPALRQSAWSYPLLTSQQVAGLSESERAQLSPSEKYDILTGRYDYPLTTWQRKSVSASDADWWGICHGWAPAAFLFNEPAAVTAVGADGVRIPFGSSDVKALLSFQQTTQGRSVMLGQRCDADLSNNPGAGASLECRDTNAGSFHVVVANEIGLRRKSFALDVTRDLEVWNQPIVSYQSQVTAQRAPSIQAAPGTVVEYQITTDLTYVIEMEPSWSPHLGLDNALRTARYVYFVEVDASGGIIGGSWVSSDRPDFLWTNRAATFSGMFAPLSSLYEASVGGATVVTPPVQPIPPPVVSDTRCPVGGAYDSEVGYCTLTLSNGDVAVLGQFTVAMTNLCEARGGGDSCRKETAYELPDGTLVFYQRWKKDFALALRGTGTCAFGSEPQARYGGYCVESTRRLDGRPVRNAFGPFPESLVTKCVDNGGGAICYTLRWDADFLASLLPSGPSL